MKQGKCILFGEHFIRNNCDAVILPLKKEINIEIKEENIKNKNNDKNKDKNNNKLEIYNQRKEKLKYNKVLSEKAVSFIEQELKIIRNYSTRCLYIITTNLPINAGLGSSASFCVAITKALQEKYNISLTEEQIFTISKKAEEIFHGITQGIDIIATILQKPIILSIKKDDKINANKLEIRKIKEDNTAIQFILINSGNKIPTKESVKQVITYSEKNKEKFSRIKDKYNEIVKKGIQILNETENIDNNQLDKIKRLGQLMNENHFLLKELGLSNNKIEQIREFAFQNNALGAKITGAGNGGYVLILIEQEKIGELLNKFYKKGYEGFST